ncbi:MULTISPECIES: hypothetical protein [Bacillus]|uniref:hypothetical protein n=1 Tax=Bacillus TaxID=1386 RepID=UPI001E3000ED|nr:hypothetical protein [Bacillus cereus]HDR4484206.1 hypothetical protein [Bacillus cereus]
MSERFVVLLTVFSVIGVLGLDIKDGTIVILIKLYHLFFFNEILSDNNIIK